MASERMRILICKFELSNAVISSRCLVDSVCPEKPQIAARAISERTLRIFFMPPWFGLVRPGCPGEPRKAPDRSQNNF